ncbi:MAG: alpha-amylase, partial [Dysgonamonadaceae bacterium]|nr:alpha-amylase [Dysgonamonadaceae bacterium]
LAFVLFAPGKETVYLFGDFNDWQVSDEYKMEKSGDRFHIKIGNLVAGKEYICQYLIDNNVLVADPYANKISDPWNDKNISPTIYPDLIKYPSGKTNGIAMTVSTRPENYNWKINNYTVNSATNLIIYEILIRDFSAKRSIKGVQEQLWYLKELGVNAIELMPFNEFEGSDSWGYNPSFYFAPENSYGTSLDFKAFIDECHVNGMAVIMDMVLNHSYGQSPLVRMYQDESGAVSPDNPWYNTRSNFANPDAQWGYDFNHESPHTQAFVDSVCAYWMKEYKVDGFRFDFTKGFSNTPHPASGDDNWGSRYDAARVKNLKRIYDEIKKRNPHAIVICEHLAENKEEKELAGHGLLLWGNLNYNMNEATMGYGNESDGGSPKGDLSGASYKQRDWTSPHLVAYMESHDEERIMFKNTAYGKEYNGYDVKQISTSLQRTAAAAVMLLSVPGPKMIWQFGELGYDVSIEQNGRLGKKPLRWNYYDESGRKALFDVFAKMIDLHKNNPVFSTSDYTADLTHNFKYIVLKSPDETVVAMANFDVIPASKNVNFSQAGNWEEYFTGNTITIAAPEESITLNPGEYRLYFNK